MNDQLIAISVLSGVFCAIGVVSSLVNIWLIEQLNQWTLFLRILWTMCWYQLVYDLFFYFDTCVVVSTTWLHFFDSMEAFGGLGVCFWILIMCYVVLDIVVLRKRTPILGIFRYLQVAVFLVTAALAAVEASCDTYCDSAIYFIFELVYYSIRAATIVISFGTFGYIYHHIRQLVTNVSDPSDLSVYILSRRMMYYPLVQFVTRLFNALYETIYTFGPYTDTVPPGQFAMRILVVITQPSAGLGFLLVFLAFQPRAREILYSGLGWSVGEEEVEGKDLKDSTAPYTTYPLPEGQEQGSERGQRQVDSRDSDRRNPLHGNSRDSAGRTAAVASGDGSLGLGTAGGLRHSFNVSAHDGQGDEGEERISLASSNYTGALNSQGIDFANLSRFSDFDDDQLLSLIRSRQEKNQSIGVSEGVRSPSLA